MNKIAKQFPLVFALLIVAVSTYGQQVSLSRNCVCTDSAITLSSKSTDSKETEYRKAKGARYNSKGDDLTNRDPDKDYFIEQTTRALPLIPVQESVVIVVGRVTKIQPYFSEDRSQIYTEISVQVENVLKNDDSPYGIKSIILDKLGGSIRLDSGKVVKYKVLINDLGDPCENNRYIFFMQKTDNGKNYNFIKGYELIEGKVFTLDTGDKKLISEKYAISESSSDEKNFLELVRREIKKNDKP